MPELVKKIQSIIAAVLILAKFLFALVNVGELPVRDIYQKEENAIRIMSFNVLCEGSGEHSMQNRKELVAQTIAEIYPDSLGVQEATPAWMLWLESRLPEYDYVGVGRDDGRFKGEFSAVFYQKEKYKVLDSGTFWISETPDVPSRGWDSACNRVCTWAVLENKNTGEQYAHINTHLDHVSVTAREKGIEMILAKARSFTVPVVCTGDFNLFEDSPLYEQLTAGVLKDTKFLAPQTMNAPTFSSFKDNPSPRNIIDYVLVNGGMKPLVYRVVNEGIGGVTVSDHYPVYADMMIEPD